MSEIVLAPTGMPPGWDEYAGSFGDALSLATMGWLAAAQRGSEETYRAYRRDLLGVGADWQPCAMKAPAWLPWCRDNGIDPLTARRSHVEAWAQRQAEAGFAPMSCARKLAAISSWYRYLNSEELTERNPARDAKRPRADARSRAIALNQDDLNRVLDAAEADGPRTEALAKLMYFGGFRVGAVLAATVGDYGWASYGKRGLLLHHKGGKTEREPLEDIVVRALDAYLATRPGAAEDEPLFATRTGCHMDQPSVWRLVRRLARNAGVESWNQLKPHGFARASHITHARDEKVDIAIIADTVHHSDVRTTLGYDSLRGSRPRSGAVLADRRRAYEAQRNGGVPS